MSATSTLAPTRHHRPNSQRPRREPVIGVYRRPADCRARAAAAGAGAARRRPNYVLRRIAVGVGAVVALVVAVVVLSGLLASLGGDPAVAAETSPAAVDAPTRHVARAGDTLWSIAHEHRGEVSHERYVDALVRLNGGASIQVGQVVQLP